MLKIRYQVHIAGEGWQDPVENWQIAGIVGQHKAIEAVRITELVNDEGTNIGFASRGYVRDYGWNTEDVINSGDIGSTGLNKPLEGIKIGLIGADADKYDVWYRLHVEDKGFLPPVRDFEPSGTEGMGLQAEAIQIILQRKSDNTWYGSDSLIPYEIMQKEVAPPAPVVEPSDSKRKRIIDTAASHVGEAGTVFQTRMGIPGQDWCAAFVGCIFIDCGLRDLICIHSYVPTIMETAQRKGQWRGRGSGYQPKSGDLILFDFNGNGTPDHIGIVHSSTGFYSTHSVEGNTGSPRRVRLQHRTSDILGYVAVPF